MISIIENELGRKLESGQRKSVPNLNQITPVMLSELRRLPSHAVNTYLKFHLHEGSEAFFEDFVRDVVHGDRDPTMWGFSDILALVRERERGEALTMSAQQLRILLADVDGERWARFSVDNARLVNRSAGASGWGAPGVLVRHAPYYWRPPRAEVVAHIVSSPSTPNAIPREVRPLPDAGFDIAFRRWIALRSSWWLGFGDVTIERSTPEQLAVAIGIGPDRVSPDGAIALAALIREAQVAFDPDKHVHGHIGPDEWFLSQ
jgi:hypothetical protein